MKNFIGKIGLVVFALFGFTLLAYVVTTKTEFGVKLFAQQAELNTYVIEMTHPLSAEEISEFSEQIGGEVYRLTPHYDSEYFSRVYRAHSALSLDEIQKMKSVTLVETPSAAVMMSIDPLNTENPKASDPLFPYQWGNQNAGHVMNYEIEENVPLTRQGRPGVDIDAPADLDEQVEKFLTTAVEKKQISDKRKYVSVAVIDYGVDINHQDLKDSIEMNDAECLNGEIPLNPTEDKDGNSLKGDCKGWNFTGKEKEGHPIQIDDVGHGTHIAGIIAAKRNNELGIAGVSNHIKILPIKVLSDDNEKKNAIVFTDRLAQAVTYAIKRKADVINLSLGYPLFADKKHIRQAILDAYNAGIVIVAAAGNNNHNAPIIPCAMDEVLCVGSISNDSTISDFSNFGAQVDVLAPGDDILSTIPTAVPQLGFHVEGYTYKSGTSQAAPYVAALAAVLRAQNPKISAKEVYNKIISSSIPNPDPSKFARAGRISFQNALKGVVSTPLTLKIKEKNLYVAWSMANKTANWNVTAVNHTDQAIVAKLKVSSEKSKGFTIANAESVNLPANQETLIPISITIEDTQAESEILLNIELTAGSQKYTGTTLLQLTRDISGDANLVRFELPNVEPSQFFTLNSFSATPIAPKYYEQSFKEDEATFRIFEIVDNKIRLNVVHKITEFDRPISIREVDVDNDSVPDIQIIAVVNDGTTTGEGEDAKEGKKIVYKNLPSKPKQEVFKNRPEWQNLDFHIEGTLEIVSELRHIPLKVDGTDYAAPFFFNNGLLPGKDQICDGFMGEDNSQNYRLYYIAPEKNKDGNWQLGTRVINTVTRMKAWKKKFGLPAFGDIRFLHSLPSHNKSEIRVLVSVGYDFNRSYYETIIRQQHDLTLEKRKALPNKDFDCPVPYDEKTDLFSFEWIPLNGKGITGVLDGFALDKTLDLTKTESDEFALVGQVSQTDHFWNYVDKTGNTLRPIDIEPRDPSEIINSYIKNYLTANGRVSFIQTVSEILVVTEKNGEQIKAHSPFHVSTFLPGQLFQERAFPVWYGVDKKLPALYVDSSQIVSRTSSMMIADGGKIRTPVSMALKIPDNCISNDPSLWNLEEYRFSFVCRVGDKFELWFLPMK